MWRHQCQRSPKLGALLLCPHPILRMDLTLPGVRLTLGGGGPLCRLSGGLFQLSTQLRFQRLP